MDDPITLDPISSLAYPPFELKANPHGSTTASDWYDGRTLALYLVSSGRFLHPISRREISRDECAALDVHLRRHRIGHGVPDVVKTFDQSRDHSASASTSSTETEADLARIRAESERALYDAMFTTRRGAQNAASAGTIPARASRAAARTAERAGARASQREAARAASSRRVSDHDGGIAIVDDDLIPTHARGLVGAGLFPLGNRPGGVITAADYGEWAEPHEGRGAPAAAATVEMPRAGRRSRGGRGGGSGGYGRTFSPWTSAPPPAERFPALPSTCDRPSAPSNALPPAVAEAVAARTAARLAAEAKAEKAEAEAIANAIAMGACFRAVQTAGAVGEAAVKFSVEARSLAISHPDLVAEIELAFDRLVASGERSRTLRSMPRQHRRLVHELSHLYFIGTIASGVEPARFIKLVRTDRTAWPACTLSVAVTAGAHVAGGAGGMGGAGGAGGAAPQLQLHDGKAAAAEAAAASSAAECAGCTAARFSICLSQVQCSERVLPGLLGVRAVGPAAQGCSIEWSPARKKDRPQARESLQLRATVTFHSEEAARTVLRTIGGGLRGQFRVEQPSWASSSATAKSQAGEGTTRVALDLSVLGKEASPEGMSSVSVTARLHVFSRGSGGSAEAHPSRSHTRRRQRGAAASADDGAFAVFTTAHEELASMLVSMGFGQNAARRAALRVGEPDQNGTSADMEPQLLLALDWLGTEPEGVDEPLPPSPSEPCVSKTSPQEQPQPHGTASHHSTRPGPPAPCKSNASRPGPSAATNRWAALIDED